MKASGKVGSSGVYVSDSVERRFETDIYMHTKKCTCVVFNNLKFALKHLKRSDMFRSYDHPQGAYFVPC